MELADFMTFLEKVQGGWDKFLSRFKKDFDPRGMHALGRAHSEPAEGISVPLLRHSKDPNPLRNLFAINPHKLPPSTVKALLEFCQTGLTWTMDYVKQYVLVPPTEKPQGKNRRKLPHKQSTARKQKTIPNNASRMVRNNARYVQARLTDPTPQVHPFLLALADMDGSMQTSSKSDILQVLQSCLGRCFQISICSQTLDR